jgi:hypothetical protein
MISTIKTADGAAVIATTEGATVSLMVRRRTPGGGPVLPVVLTFEPSEAMLFACELERAANKAHSSAARVAA